MKKSLYLFSFNLLLCVCVYAQQDAQLDGDWKKQFVFLKNTTEADLMIRVGDIDNLGFGWAQGFNPFFGKSTEAHGYPWAIDSTDAPGTDRIFVPTSYSYENGSAPYEGYTGYTERPNNLPVPITIPLSQLKGITVKDATLQLFVDDFQSPELHSKFQVKINGVRFVEAEKILNTIDQEGPIGKLVSFRFTDELLELLKPESSLTIAIDDPITAMGDGFAIDFAKLVINSKEVIYKGNIAIRVTDADTHQPIANAVAAIKEYATAVADSDGIYLLKDVPAGLNIVTASAPGYASTQMQVDVVANETTTEIEIELKHSAKLKYNNNVMQEGDSLVMNSIQFEIKSANLLPTAKPELDNLAAFMKDNPKVEIMLLGYTSSEGLVIANRELSLKRVRSCKNYLAKKGIDEGRIIIRGFGSDNPVAPNDTEVNRAKNRRVEMKITKL